MELSKAELKLLYGYIRKMSDKFDFMGQEMTVEEADVISKIADEVCSPAQKLPDDGMVYEDEDGNVRASGQPASILMGHRMLREP